jgi:transposase
LPGNAPGKRFIEGQHRAQSLLLPECLGDFDEEDDPARVIAAFVDEIELAGPSIDSVKREATGRSAYHPSLLLKIYVYGYVDRVQSSLVDAWCARRNATSS